MRKIDKLYLDIHNQMKKDHGYSAKALWGSERSQKKRFQIFLNYIIDKSSKIKVLDIGSGLGDFYTYLIDLGFDVDYTGLEINESFHKFCQEKFPKANFILGNVDKLKSYDLEFDYVFASGIYNLGNKKNAQKAFVNDFQQLFKKINIAACVNFLSSNSINQDEVSVYHSSSEIISLVEENFTKNYILDHNYLPNDFTLIFHKTSSSTYL